MSRTRKDVTDATPDTPQTSFSQRPVTSKSSQHGLMRLFGTSPRFYPISWMDEAAKLIKQLFYSAVFIWACNFFSSSFSCLLHFTRIGTEMRGLHLMNDLYIPGIFGGLPLLDLRLPGSRKEVFAQIEGIQRCLNYIHAQFSQLFSWFWERTIK